MATTVPNQADNATDRTMVMFNLGVQAGLTQAAERTRLARLARSAATITLLDGEQRTLAAARHAAQAAR